MFTVLRFAENQPGHCLSVTAARRRDLTRSDAAEQPITYVLFHSPANQDEVRLSGSLTVRAGWTEQDIHGGKCLNCVNLTAFGFKIILLMKIKEDESM